MSVLSRPLRRQHKKFLLCFHVQTFQFSEFPFVLRHIFLHEAEYKYYFDVKLWFPPPSPPGTASSGQHSSCYHLAYKKTKIKMHNPLKYSSAHLIAINYRPQCYSISHNNMAIRVDVAGREMRMIMWADSRLSRQAQTNRQAEWRTGR